MAGTNFTDIILLGGLAVGLYLFYTECIVKSACGLPGGGTTGDTTVVDPGVGGDDPGAGVSDPASTSNCKSLCKAGDCDGYDQENCTAGCSQCKSGGGSGGTGGSSSGSAVNCNDGNSCNTRCAKRWCTSFGKCCKGKSCAYCNSSGSNAGTQKCTPCSKNYHRVGTYPCKCALNKGAKDTNIACKAVTQCPSCGAGRTRTVANCRCGCKSSSPPTSSNCSSLCAKALCGTYKNSGCKAKCKYCPGSGYTYTSFPGFASYHAIPLNHGTFGQGGAFSKQQAFRQTYQFPRNTYRRVVASMSNSSGVRIPRVEGVRRGYV